MYVILPGMSIFSESFESLVNLREKDLRSEGLFLAEGRLLVERSVHSSCEVLGIAADAAAAEEAHVLAAGNIPVTVFGKEKMDNFAGFAFHRGMLALVRRPHVLPAERSFPLRGNVLVLPAITDPGNLGTLLRSALAFKFDTIYTGMQSCDLFNRKTLRSSMGAALVISLYSASPEDLVSLAGEGLPILAAAMEEDAYDAWSDASRYANQSHIALVLGNEHDGIPAEWRKKCTESIQIPVSPAVDSLNVAIAGSILMWQLSRQALP